MKLAEATVLTIDGPGDEWLMLCRGTRTTTDAAKQTRSTPRRRTGNA